MPQSIPKGSMHTVAPVPSHPYNANKHDWAHTMPPPQVIAAYLILIHHPQAHEPVSSSGRHEPAIGRSSHYRYTFLVRFEGIERRQTFRFSTVHCGRYPFLRKSRQNLHTYVYWERARLTRIISFGLVVVLFESRRVFKYQPSGWKNRVVLIRVQRFFLPARGTGSRSSGYAQCRKHSATHMDS